jgi:hypothetical protein
MFVFKKYISPHTQKKKDYVVTGMVEYGTAGSEITKPYGIRLWSAASRPSCFCFQSVGLLCRVDLQGAQDMARQTKQARRLPLILKTAQYYYLLFYIFFLFLDQKYYLFLR